MNLNNLQDISKILEKAQNFINEEIGKLPKEEQAKLRDLETWAKSASIEDLRKKEEEYKTKKPK